ncbi:hypothetical protein, partial [Ewingella allii]|uniref:hypothetical protein n=1 Tax=Ewingella allii TaxID=3092550 RepID=UPI00379F6AD8
PIKDLRCLRTIPSAIFLGGLMLIAYAWMVLCSTFILRDLERAAPYKWPEERNPQAIFLGFFFIYSKG